MEQKSGLRVESNSFIDSKSGQCGINTSLIGVKWNPKC